MTMSTRSAGDHAMVTLGSFSRPVSGIHAAAVTPQGWDSARYDIRRATGGSQASLVSAPPDVGSINATTLPDAAPDSYAAYYHRTDDARAEAGVGKVGEIRRSTELVAPQQYSECHNELADTRERLVLLGGWWAT
ncbi:MAG TPA: hypothetical protein VFW21_00355 [Mycobacterium sp.]|nr:hypothetical protein [Mycobacterium sp.]